MDAPAWTVLRCASCGQCFARKAGQQAKCSRCGLAANEASEVVSHAANVQQLQHEIAMANVPEELREELASKLAPPKPTISHKDDDPRSLRHCLIDAAKDGIVDKESVQSSLAKMNISMRAIDLLDMAYQQGLLLQLSEDEWQLIE
tara:strand:- start:39 stop:476 length:438 start_codon:yes stop_codon:yes gene_type:complete